MDAVAARQDAILSRAREIGRVAVDDLADALGVTPQTIRKDLNDLCDRRLLRRVHGGAVVTSGVENLGYEARRALAWDEKHLIGIRAAALIPSEASLFINIGTTTEAVAEALTEHHGLLVITNNINVANTLRPSPAIEVIVAGGVVRRSDGGIVGEAAVEFMRQFKVDYAVIGASGIEEDGALLDFDYREVRVAQAIIANARRVILVADSSKFGRPAPVRIASMTDIHSFVTDHLPSDRLKRACAAAGVAVEEVLPDGPRTHD